MAPPPVVSVQAERGVIIISQLVSLREGKAILPGGAGSIVLPQPPLAANSPRAEHTYTGRLFAGP